MSWLGLLLVGVGVTDLVFSIGRRHVLPECVGAAAVVVFWLLAGLTSGRDVVALVLLVVVVVAWGQTVSRAFGDHLPTWVPLLVLGSALVAAGVLSGAAGHADGVLRTWLDGTSFPGLAGLDADAALVLVGVLLVQTSTGNVLVRLVLAATGTVNPARHGESDDPETQLKGGRLLGPMERLFIVGLGLAGHLTAASIVIAAKGLLRFPELQSRREQQRIQQLTEYLLVGSFLSWLVALTGLFLMSGTAAA